MNEETPDDKVLIPPEEEPLGSLWGGNLGGPLHPLLRRSTPSGDDPEYVVSRVGTHRIAASGVGVVSVEQ